jgi:hypothetical protein
MTPLDNLRQLLRQLLPSDPEKTIADILGSTEVAIAILKGDLRISKAHAIAIAKALEVDPELFRYPIGRPKQGGRMMWIPAKFVSVVEKILKGDRLAQSDLSERSSGPVADPFKITRQQAALASERMHELHLKNLEQPLSREEEQQREIFENIFVAASSESWAKRGMPSQHWDNGSARAIAHLCSIGFQSNEDVERFLENKK